MHTILTVPFASSKPSRPRSPFEAELETAQAENARLSEATGTASPRGLLAALAAYQESILRMVADNLEVQIDSLEVVAHGEVDARGCLAMEDTVTVGFEAIHLEVHMEVAADTDSHRVELLKGLAERLCVTADTLRRGADLRVTYPS